MCAPNNTWEIWIDRGGTFTDVVALAPDGSIHVRKRPSLSDSTAIDPGLAAARDILSTVSPAAVVSCFKVGTTVATNALLQRRMTPTVFVTTRGFADALIIGSQHRADIFALQVQRPAPLFAGVLEIDERLSVGGETIVPLDIEVARTALLQLRSQGWRALAIALLHGWRHSRHEQQLAALARTLGFEEVSVAHELLPVERYLPRAATTVLNATLAPTLRNYVQQLRSQIDAHFPGAALHFMQSSGGLVHAAGFRALASVLSGPAGGLIGMSRIGMALGHERLIGFDMGGTSTDVALHDRALPKRFGHEIAGARISTPMLDVHTIAAGGGSVLAVVDGRLTVGPYSAAADPGPACYARGGPATLTDIQMLLGRLRPEFLPRVFGSDGQSPADAAASVAALTLLAHQLQREPHALAAAFLDVAVETMANAIRQVSTRQGLNPADFVLFAFGGAAGQHALRVAEACGMTAVLMHPLSSVLSAVGIGVADWLETRRASAAVPLNAASLRSCQQQLEMLEQDARAALKRQALGELPLRVERVLELRAGESEVAIDVSLDATLDIEEANNVDNVVQAYALAFTRRFGHAAPVAELRIDALRVAVSAARAPASMATAEASAFSAHIALPRHARAWFRGWQQVPVIQVAELPRNLAITGPALIVEPHFTLVLEPGWSLRRHSGGALLAERDTAPRPPGAAQAAAHSMNNAEPNDYAVAQTPDPARLEIFNNLFMHIAEEMGTVLQQTAQSVNIKERLDFSCALFDAHGALIANAPHMPVHLGSMGISVRAVIASHAGAIRPGDAWLLNSPYHGGTHLPDITVVSPAFIGAGAEPDFYLASRAHHADIGGITPGSMPPFSQHIDEEGVLFEDFQLVSAGTFREAALREALAAARWPARNADQNVADLRAQLAANARGALELQRATLRHGLPMLRQYMQHVQTNAGECVRKAIARLSPGRYRVELDGGQVIAVEIHIDADAGRARVDFSGSSPQGPHNFNAPRAVCVAAVLYVFRTLVDRPIPLNEGCLAPLDIVIPAGCMLDPLPGAAVVAGNVETSQCIVDALYGALGMQAGAQGTMNNLTFGNDELQYYETLCGGSGAAADFDGCDAVQTHMTNSRLTDPEILEKRFPVRLREFSVRRNSGGAGRHHGGDGAIRDVEFLAPLSGAMLANRRRIAPRGIAGGADAARGETMLIRANGRTETLSACAVFEVAAGDRIVVRTPGGGGFGLS